LSAAHPCWCRWVWRSKLTYLREVRELNRKRLWAWALTQPTLGWRGYLRWRRCTCQPGLKDRTEAETTRKMS